MVPHFRSRSLSMANPEKLIFKSYILGLEWALNIKPAPIWISWAEEATRTPNILHLYGSNFGWKSLLNAHVHAQAQQFWNATPCVCCLHNHCSLATLCYTMTSTCLQDLPFHIPVYNTSLACMQVVYVMEDNRIRCSRGHRVKQASCLYIIMKSLPLPQ